MINKVVQSIENALIGVESEMTLMFGGFGLSGIPEKAIKALSKKDIFNLTLSLIHISEPTRPY